MEWLRYLRSVQALGFTLADIEAGMPLLANPVNAGAELRAALERKLGDIDARTAGLAQLRAALASKIDVLGADCPLRPATGSSIVIAA